jgi:hypothetical protein
MKVLSATYFSFKRACASPCQDGLRVWVEVRETILFLWVFRQMPFNAATKEKTLEAITH